MKDSMTMDISQETRERLEDQISWYDKKSSSNQTWYKVCRGIVLVSAALIPVSTNFPIVDFFAGLVRCLNCRGGRFSTTESISSELDDLPFNL